MTTRVFSRNIRLGKVLTLVIYRDTLQNKVKNSPGKICSFHQYTKMVVMCSPTLITASCGSDLMAEISSLRLSISPSCRSSKCLPFHRFNISTTVDMMFLDMLVTSGSIDISWRIAEGLGGMLVIVVGNARSNSGMSMIYKLGTIVCTR